MPPWAAAVCRQWRAVLERLDRAPGTVATRLDWAIKHALYGDQLRRRGFSPRTVSLWSAVAARLAAALADVSPERRTLTAELALARDSPIAGRVAELTAAVLEPNDLCWDDLPAFLAARSALCEIDMRFGLLGADGIFTTLAARGLLARHVDGVDEPGGALDTPPPGTRAQARGALVRQLTGGGGRYFCTWQGVWDRQERRRVVLEDPFATTWEWTDWPRLPEGLSSEGLSSERLLAEMTDLAALRERARSALRRARGGGA
jgi:hypothetical protein